MPVCLAPNICVLLYAQQKAKLSRVIASPPGICTASIKTAVLDMDFAGLLLLGTALALILLPVRFAPEAHRGWKSPGMVCPRSEACAYLVARNGRCRGRLVSQLLSQRVEGYQDCPCCPSSGSVSPASLERVSPVFSFDFVSFYLQCT